MKKMLIAIAVLFLPTSLLAQEQSNYQCSIDEVIRRVEIVYETGVSVPCEVHYYKDTEMPGEREVLWRAVNEEGYCEARATEFVETLRGTGWTCWATDRAGSDGENDDTDALAPADEVMEAPE